VSMTDLYIIGAILYALYLLNFPRILRWFERRSTDQSRPDFEVNRHGLFTMPNMADFPRPYFPPLVYAPPPPAVQYVPAPPTPEPPGRVEIVLDLTRARRGRD